MTIKELIDVLPDAYNVEIVLNSADCEDDANNIVYDRDNRLLCDALDDYIIANFCPTYDDRINKEGVLIYVKTEVKPLRAERR